MRNGGSTKPVSSVDALRVSKGLTHVLRLVTDIEQCVGTLGCYPCRERGREAHQDGHEAVGTDNQTVFLLAGKDLDAPGRQRGQIGMHIWVPYGEKLSV
jgi:hypothetical protein